VVQRLAQATLKRITPKRSGADYPAPEVKAKMVQTG